MPSRLRSFAHVWIQCWQASPWGHTYGCSICKSGGKSPFTKRVRELISLFSRCLMRHDTNNSNKKIRETKCMLRHNTPPRLGMKNRNTDKLNNLRSLWQIEKRAMIIKLCSLFHSVIFRVQSARVGNTLHLIYVHVASRECSIGVIQAKPWLKWFIQ